MNVFRKILRFFVSLITILMQGALGMIAGTLAVSMSNGQMPLALIYTGIGIWAGVFLLGAIVLALRKNVRPRKFLSRLLLSLVGAAIPIAILSYFGASEGYDSPRITGGLGLEMTLLAALLSIIGFYAPGWSRRKKEEAVG